MAVEAERDPIVEDIVSMFAYMVFLVASCWVKVLVSTRSGSRDVSLILGTAERPAA